MYLYYCNRLKLLYCFCIVSISLHSSQPSSLNDVVVGSQSREIKHDFQIKQIDDHAQQPHILKNKQVTLRDDLCKTACCCCFLSFIFCLKSNFPNQDSKVMALDHCKMT